MPPELAQEIERAYIELGRGLVAVRSSATAEDLPEASFAGQQRTFLNMEGGKEVVKAVQGCWASLFEARAIFYREEQDFDHFKVGIAVPVQRMVQSEASGVMFTIEPVTSEAEEEEEEAADLDEDFAPVVIRGEQYLAEPASVEEAMRLGAHAYCMKPIDRSELERKVDEVLSQAS